MNTFMSYLAVTALFALVLLPVILGLARERRIDRQLREARRRWEAAPRGTTGAAQPAVATRRPYLRTWANLG
ncbi:MAG TPA: hypothetical protein VN520_09290 [Streptomyces sp.]|uniref:hypothetical protein n=1 Tax=Streptomyces sp. TaxID=1931 RepID=UPI002C78275B|nr:hypothetical protein [Streptomyces sp.]HWU06560.1 hypothetical protein [Streptomyces sp.]